MVEAHRSRIACTTSKTCWSRSSSARSRERTAIHAYDGIVWKIRSGFVTLLFGGWSILLMGIVQTKDRSAAGCQPLAWGLVLFSLEFAFGARYVDRSYIRRKFRVIAALDRLIDEVRSCAGDYRVQAKGVRVAFFCSFEERGRVQVIL